MEFSEIKHDEMVRALAKSGDAILQSMNGDDAHNLHMAVGVCGEAGELMDAIKKAVIYRKPLDRANVVEEIGDLMFYITGLLQGTDISMDECINNNIQKLSKRYSSGTYTNSDAIARKDKI